MKTNDGSAATHDKIKELAMQISSIIDQAPEDIVGDLRDLSVSLIAPEYKKGGRELGVMQIGITKGDSTKMVTVHGGVITGNTMTYDRYIAGKKETVTETLPERFSFNA